ncbi:hypothetical protein KPH14_001410 [Odynerus spinipes]|uniref:Copper homeostasis protein cutC homolog n=1 Tax=Odynerus spinipes TaxID=1348599 RepID=A0AAD9RUE6_9HYME|nr:hypothetical protein KPH14_001410 [Odynerus spinipes]
MEICVDSLESARNAVNGGASRLELCAALSEGGLTPTPGLVKLVRSVTTVPIYAMIRVRAGDFVYSRDEMDAMSYDLKILKDLNVNGFVFGALTVDREIDINYCKEIISAASPLPVTFHRAFDEVVDPSRALETLIDLGFERILSSGQKNTAEEGLDLLREIVRQATGRISIMPGSGIDSTNISKIKMATDAKEFHASAKRRKLVHGDANRVRIGAVDDKNFIMVTDTDVVKKMVEIINAGVKQLFALVKNYHAVCFVVNEKENWKIERKIDSNERKSVSLKEHSIYNENGAYGVLASPVNACAGARPARVDSGPQLNVAFCLQGFVFVPTENYKLSKRRRIRVCEGKGYNESVTSASDFPVVVLGRSTKKRKMCRS